MEDWKNGRMEEWKNGRFPLVTFRYKGVQISSTLG
jgi:hypothetical protein